MLRRKVKREDDENRTKHEPVPVTPRMLVKSLRALTDAKLFGVYFSPSEVTDMISYMYPLVEFDQRLLYQEVKDKLLCAAVCGFVGSKMDTGFYSLTHKNESMMADLRSERTFWSLYKRIVDNRDAKGEGSSATYADYSFYRHRRRRDTMKLIERRKAAMG